MLLMEGLFIQDEDLSFLCDVRRETCSRGVGLAIASDGKFAVATRNCDPLTPGALRHDLTTTHDETNINSRHRDKESPGRKADIEGTEIS